MNIAYLYVRLSNIEIDAFAYTKYILKRVYKTDYHHYDPLYDEILKKLGLIWKKIRRIRQALTLINNELNINLTYYEINKLYEEGFINGIRFGKTIYIYYDDLLNYLRRKYNG